MKPFLFAILITLTSTTFAAEYRVQKVKVLGPMKHEVILQSKDLKKIKGSNVLKGKLVIQWGLHAYEVVSGMYVCNAKNFCKLTDYETVSTFEKCVVKPKTKVECRKRTSGERSEGRSGDVIFADPDSVSDEYNSRRPRYEDELNEFPVRINDEFDNIF